MLGPSTLRDHVIQVTDNPISLILIVQLFQQSASPRYCHAPTCPSATITTITLQCYKIIIDLIHNNPTSTLPAISAMKPNASMKR